MVGATVNVVSGWGEQFAREINAEVRDAVKDSSRVAAQEAARAAELHLNVFDTQVAINVIDAMNLAAGALDHFAASCIEMLSVDAERCRALAAQVSRT